MNKTDKRAVLRIGLGGILGIAVMIPVGGLFNDLVSGGLISMGFHTPFRLISSQLVWLVGSQPLALVIQLLLYFAMGAVAALATLPFADDGKSLLLRSLAHFMVTAGLLSLTTWLLGWAWNWQALAVYLILLAAVYLLIWLARWVGWYAEVADLRSRLGLAPGPSPLKWRSLSPIWPLPWGCASCCLSFCGCWTLPTCRCSPDCCCPICCIRWGGSFPVCPWAGGLGCACCILRRGGFSA